MSRSVFCFSFDSCGRCQLCSECNDEISLSVVDVCQCLCVCVCDVTELKRDPRRLGGLLYDLTFVNVTTKDAQVIQCNISNKHGYNFTNAYINVYSK